jgi:methyl-accepting chemotaxis protein
VASEVRSLAQRSAEAAKEIKTLISTSTSQVAAGVKLVDEAGSALSAIGVRVAEMDALVSEISASAQEQATGLQQVNTAVNQMDQVTQQNAAMVEETTAAAANLKTEAAQLASLVERFETGSGGPQVHTLKPRPGAPVSLVRDRAKIVAFAGGGAASSGGMAREDGWEEF